MRGRHLMARATALNPYPGRTTSIDTLMSAEADAVCGAGYGQTGPERGSDRNAASGRSGS